MEERSYKVNADHNFFKEKKLKSGHLRFWSPQQDRFLNPWDPNILKFYINIYPPDQASSEHLSQVKSYICQLSSHIFMKVATIYAWIFINPSQEWHFSPNFYWSILTYNSSQNGFKYTDYKVCKLEEGKHIPFNWRELQNLPSTTGKFDKKATKAGGVASNISSNALIVWPPTAAIMGFDKALEAVGTPAAVVVWKFPAPTVKEN